MTIEQSQPIPVEKGWPLLGVLPKLLRGDPYEYLKSVMLEQGDFVQLNFGPQPVYLISHPDYLKRILWENHLNYRKPGMLYDTAREVMGNGLVLSDGDFWLRQRRMIQPHLHRKQLTYLFDEMVDSIAEVLNSWETMATSGTQVELHEKMADITINVITRTMFGHGMLPPTEVAEIGRSIMYINNYNGTTVYTSMLPKWFPIPGRRQYERDLSKARETVNQIIAKCRQEKETSASLIQMLINSVDEESQQQMTEQQLFDEVMTIFIAGYDTTASVLTWLGAILANHPDVLEKLQAEIDPVLGGRIPSFEDIPRLTYTRQVFMETMRMYAVTPFLPRTLKEADQLGQYHLPANATILVFFHGVHHNPHVWEQPEVFDPERFTTERMAGQNAFAYVPFSAGPRKCVGNDFALLEGTLIMAMVFQRYNLNILPNQTFTSMFSGIRHPKNGVKVNFLSRNSA